MQETLKVCLWMSLGAETWPWPHTSAYKELWHSNSELQTCKSWEIAFGFLACFKSSLSLTVLPLLEVGTQ
jgi:hypothetical protein